MRLTAQDGDATPIRSAIPKQRERHATQHIKDKIGELLYLGDFDEDATVAIYDGIIDKFSPEAAAKVAAAALRPVLREYREAQPGKV